MYQLNALKPETGSLMDLAIKEMERRKAVHAQRYLPYYFASTMCHELNMQNQKEPFYVDESGPMQLRLHHLHLAPTGGGKTYWIENIGRKAFALLRDTNAKITYKGSMTAAAFVGTVRFGTGNAIMETQGVARRYSESIIMIEEFHSTLKSMDSTHGEDLENHFLTAMDSGWVFRDLAPQEIAYQSHCTIQAASQFTRVKTSSGMLRRFLVTSFKPTKEDIVRLRMARRARRRMFANLEKTLEEVTRIRRVFNDVKLNIEQIKGLAVEEEEIDAFFDEIAETKYLPHYDEDVYERFIIGLNIAMKRDMGEIPVIRLEEGMKPYIMQAIQWRHEALVGAELSLALSTIRDWNSANTGDNMTAKEFRIAMVNFGLSFEESAAILQKLKRYGIVKEVNRKLWTDEL